MQWSIYIPNGDVAISSLQKNVPHFQTNFKHLTTTLLEKLALL